ncbi:MAG TPA: GH116 family glycosyl hydrolase, partial [Gemmataceae bacterium]|nr:GH116 family glycosyl hydrolase [Gemmataceae bacterium]
GVIEDQQPNTYDINFVGPNAFVGALYLAALEAAARMADVQGDHDFAGRCRAIAERGRQWSVENLWNGAYFIQRIPPGQPTRFQYGDGCLADQLLGQNWADQVDLGHVYPADKVRTALQSIYRYNWAPDVAAQNRAHPPQRWFARPGEAGLFICTWPRDHRMKEPVLYRDEVWTGTEYEVAACLLAEGMLREGLSIIRGIHDRYDGRHHNPWNEVECGDHYARAMASWGCLPALCGFVYDGPAGRLGFAPRFRPEDFRAYFTAAEGWGSLRQRRAEGRQESAVEVKHGKVSVRELVLEVPDNVRVKEARVSLHGKALPASGGPMQDGRKLTVRLGEPAVIQTGETLSAAVVW